MGSNKNTFIAAAVAGALVPLVLIAGPFVPVDTRVIMVVVVLLCVAAVGLVLKAVISLAKSADKRRDESLLKSQRNANLPTSMFGTPERVQEPTPAPSIEEIDAMDETLPPPPVFLRRTAQPDDELTEAALTESEIESLFERGQDDVATSVSVSYVPNSLEEVKQEEIDEILASNEIPPPPVEEVVEIPEEPVEDIPEPVVIEEPPAVEIESSRLDVEMKREALRAQQLANQRAEQELLALQIENAKALSALSVDTAIYDEIMAKNSDLYEDDGITWKRSNFFRETVKDALAEGGWSEDAARIETN